MSIKKTMLVADLLRYAEQHEVDLLLLLLALCWTDGDAAGEEGEAEPVDVPAHYYPH
jgi:hypothetical protein